jgi:predicted ABC-type sugar transport system permease subunit
MVKLSRTTFSFFTRFDFCSAATLTGSASTGLPRFARVVFGLAALAVTAFFFGASTGATASALPFERAGDETAFFAGFLVLGATMVIISVWEILKTVYIVCPVFYAARWTKGERESCPQFLFARV